EHRDAVVRVVATTYARSLDQSNLLPRSEGRVRIVGRAVADERRALAEREEHIATAPADERVNILQFSNSVRPRHALPRPAAERRELVLDPDRAISQREDLSHPVVEVRRRDTLNPGHRVHALPPEPT